MHSRVLILLVCLYFAEAKVLNLSKKQIKWFVDGHNSRRLLLQKGKVKGQPAAHNMKPMTWDEELAAKAATWASTHSSNHNPDKTVRSRRFSTGENLYWLTTTSSKHSLNVNAVLKAWFKEYKDYKFGPMSWKDFSNSGPQTGHYTQMAWATTTHVGCGASEIIVHGAKKLMVVCNYGPSGNVIGQTPYEADKRCSHHRRGKCNRRPNHYQLILEASLQKHHHRRH